MQLTPERTGSRGWFAKRPRLAEVFTWVVAAACFVVASVVEGHVHGAARVAYWVVAALALLAALVLSRAVSRSD